MIYIMGLHTELGKYSVNQCSVTFSHKQNTWEKLPSTELLSTKLGVKTPYMYIYMFR